MKKNIIIIILLSLISFLSFSQNKEDILLLKECNYKNTIYNQRQVNYGFKKSNTINPVYHFFSLSMYVYQKYISPILSRSCVFSPSCSEYSKDLIKEYGLLEGIIFTSDRLTRCTRISMADKHKDFFNTKNMKHKEDVFLYRLNNKKTK